MVRAEFFQGVIRSAERMTYTNVNKVIEGDVEMTERYAPLAGEFRRMKELALLLNKRRQARGSIDFDLPEPVIEFDDDGRMVSIVRSERNIAHRLIEEFMLAANEAVAEYLEKRGVGFAASRARKAGSEESAGVRRSWRTRSDIRWAWMIWRSGGWWCGMGACVRKRARDAAVAGAAGTHAGR